MAPNAPSSPACQARRGPLDTAAVLATSWAAAADSRRRCSSSMCESARGARPRGPRRGHRRPDRSAAARAARHRRLDVDARHERRDGGRGDGRAQHRQRLERGARGRLERRQSHAEAPNRARANSRRSASGTPRVRPSAASTPATGPYVSSSAAWASAAPPRIEAVQLDLGDRGADRGGERIAADHDDPPERAVGSRSSGASAGSWPRRVRSGDVVDHEHARPLRERLRERAGHAAQGALGPRAERQARSPGWQPMIVHGAPSPGAARRRAGSCRSRAPRGARPGAPRRGAPWLGQLALPTYERNRAHGCHRVRDLRCGAA